MYTLPSVETFKTYFDRDFNYAPDGDSDNLDYVTDNDITKAYEAAQLSFNDQLFGDYAEIPFMWISAFFLVSSLKISSQGLSSQANFPISSTSIGNVSIGYAVPEKYTKDAFISQFTGNAYGLKYLSFLIPRLVGNISVVGGETLP